MPASTPQLARLADAIVELRTLAVPYRAIADGFGCTENHARQLAFRGHRERQSFRLQVPDWRWLHAPSEGERAHVRRRLGVRLDEDAVVVGPRAASLLERLRAAIRAVVGDCSDHFRCEEAIRRLRRLREWQGFAASAERLRVHGELSSALAFFHVHSGRTYTAALHAVEAAYLFSCAQHESGDVADWHSVANACELCAHAHSLAGQPDQVLGILEIVRAARTAAGGDLGANYFRLAGVAHYQLGSDHDIAAARSFARAAQLTAEAPNTKARVEVDMNGARHLNALEREPDRGIDLHARVVAHYGPKSLQASMTAHWAAVAGLSTDSKREQRIALERVVANADVAGRFGHQASISALLTATPRLRLNGSQLEMWTRYSLYANAYRAE